MSKKIGVGSFVLLSLVASDASAQAETLQVDFDLAQYSQTGHTSFSLGCNATPPTGRTNYVHITAVWLEDGSGNYVTTLYRWGRTYLYNLEKWAAASNFNSVHSSEVLLPDNCTGLAVGPCQAAGECRWDGATCATRLPILDGITRATPTSNGNAPAQVFKSFSTGALDISWIPDGPYTLRLETTQCENAGEYRTGYVDYFGPDASFPFTKGRTNQTNVDLGDSTPFNNVTVTYSVPVGNAPPSVWAGPDVWVDPLASPTTTLTGVASDPDVTPTLLWEQVRVEPAGPVAQIASPTSLSTNITFTAAGIYTFRLTADDGALTNSNEVTVFVNTHALDPTHDGYVNSQEGNTAKGTLASDGGEWLIAYGPCSTSTNPTVRLRPYLRFDTSVLSQPPILARLRLPVGEVGKNAGRHQEFYILDDSEDDWNGSSSSTDWEASTTFNNQVVSSGNAANLDPGQLVGARMNDACFNRHAYIDPDQPPGPPTVCPGWFDIDLDAVTLDSYDDNAQWSIFITPVEDCSGMQVGSKENDLGPTLLVVEHWQDSANVAPDADAGSDFVVTDTFPSGSEAVPLDASGSSDETGIISYQWREGGVLLASVAQPNGASPILSLGIHDIELTVVDGGTLSDTDTLQVIVDDRFYPNDGTTNAPLIDGTPQGKLYDDLFAHSAAPAGDWYALGLVDGSALAVQVDMQGGNLDLAILDATSTVLASATTAALSESASATALNAGRYYIRVDAAGGAASTYAMTVTVTGPTLTVSLAPSSIVETAGTVSGAGTVTADAPVTGNLSVSLNVNLPASLSVSPNPLTIPAGATSATFDITVVDDPPSTPQSNRYATIAASAAGFNGGSAVLEILDNEATLVVVWDRVAETLDETGNPLVVLKAVLSGTPTSLVTIPFTISGSATQGVDFTLPGAASTLTINGATEASLLLSILDDGEIEDDETLVVTMGTPTGANLGGAASYTLTLRSDDTEAEPAPTPPGEVAPVCGCGATSGLELTAYLMAIVWFRRRRAAHRGGESSR